MTPAPIPEYKNIAEIATAAGALAVTTESAINILKAMQAYADQEVAKALASQQTMRWVKAKNELPGFSDEEFHLRCRRGDIVDRWTAFYDHKEKEFYMVKEDCGMDYFSLDDYPDLEWLLDESPAPIQ